MPKCADLQTLGLPVLADVQAFGSLSFKHQRRRLDILVEGICRVGKAALRIRAVV